MASKSLWRLSASSGLQRRRALLGLRHGPDQRRGGAGGLSAAGIPTFDGNGNATVLQSVSRNGDYSFDETGAFTYLANPDCTGFGYSDDGDKFTRFVVVHGGEGLYMFSESEGNAVHGVGTKIAGD